MQFKILAVALLGSAALAQEVTPTPTLDPFGSVVESLITVYIPPTVLISLGAAVQSAASAAGQTGDLEAILSSALADTTPPSWITAIPTQYQSNINALSSAISSLRASATAISAGTGSLSNSTITSGSSAKSGTPIAPTKPTTTGTAGTASSSSAAAMPAAIVPGAASIFGLLGVLFAL